MKNTKKCNNCHTDRLLDEFQNCAANPDGRNNKCKSCVKEYRRNQRLKNYDKNLVSEKRIRCERKWYNRLYTSSRASARQTGRTHNITTDFLKELYDKQNGKCFWLGIPLGLEGSLPNRHPSKISIDRLDCSRGYEPDNVVLTCTFANLGRTDTTVAVLVDFLTNTIPHMIQKWQQPTRNIEDNTQ